MEIKDLSWNEVISKRFNHPLLPRSIRGIIVGKSGCGKTTLLLNLLLRPGWLDYDNLFIFGKSLFQPEYRILKTAFEEELPKEYILRMFNMRDEIQNSQIPPSLVVKEWAKEIKKKSDIRYNFFESASDVPDPRELSSEDKNLMVFDDLLLEKQNKCESYYVRGRHSNVDCFYLAQNYFKLPRQTIRIRGIIVGKSGCGKTTLLLNLLLRPGWLDYDNLFIFGKSLFQPEYRILKTAFEEELPKEYILRMFNMRDEIQNSQIPPSLVVKEWAKEIKKKSDIRYNFFESASDVPDPRELSSEDKNLMVFDDLLLEKQNKCESYYVRGRHSNVDCFYLAQNYFKLPRQTIRENSNLICLFPQDLKNINHIYSDHVGDDMKKEEFRRFCKKCWDKPYG